MGYPDLTPISILSSPQNFSSLSRTAGVAALSGCPAITSQSVLKPHNFPFSLPFQLPLSTQFCQWWFLLRPDPLSTHPVHCSNLPHHHVALVVPCSVHLAPYSQRSFSKTLLSSCQDPALFRDSMKLSNLAFQPSFMYLFHVLFVLLSSYPI